MTRALTALFLVCLVVGNIVLDTNLNFVSPSSDRVIGVLLAYALVAVPIFLFLASSRGVQWWHLFVVGMAAAGAYVLFTGRYDAVYGPSYISWIALRCAVASLAFWFLGIWRNPRFPDVPSALPVKSFAVLAPVMALWAVGFVWLSASKVDGVIESIVMQEGADTATIQLSDGQKIEASMMRASSPMPGPRRCVELNTRHGVVSSRRYWIENSYRCDTAKSVREMSAYALR